jgi:hypothetical protein
VKGEWSGGDEQEGRGKGKDTENGIMKPPSNTV